MPTGKVKWFDAEKGFGFIHGDDGEDVFLPASALPEGETSVKGGTRVEFGTAVSRGKTQALSVQILEKRPSVRANMRERDRKPAEDLAVIVEDTIKVLDNIGNSLRRGRYPERAQAQKIATLLRGVAHDLEQ